MKSKIIKASGSLIVMILFIFCNYVMAQVSEGGKPYSFTFTKSISALIDTITMPPVDVKALLREDEENKTMNKRYRFGFAIDVDLGLSNAGTWEILPNGDQLWRLCIVSKGAISINLIYDRYLLPEGAKFFIYSKDKSMVIGAFTARNNKPHGKFSTDLVKGDVITLEYYEPAYVKKRGLIHISKVIHGYKDVLGFGKKYSTKGFDDSGDCNIDVNCKRDWPEPWSNGRWTNEINTVAMILLGSGAELCSGFLINNVREDTTRYFMSANHCYTCPGCSDVDTWIFRFNYQSPDCQDTVDGPKNYTVSGADLKAHNSASDFLLLELQEAIPDSYKVHYAGWYNPDSAANRTCGIHHPSGDVKKISFDSDPPVSGIYWGNSHWRVIWDAGTTEGGSSGSPLFNENHLVVGQLHGGTASCYNPSGWDEYGKFAWSWDYGSSSSNRLKDWLNPDNTDSISLRQIAAYDLLIDENEFFSSSDPAGNYFNTVGKIETDGTVTIPSNVDVTFRAKDEIILNPGFTANLGCSFYAYVDPGIGGGLGKLASSGMSDPSNLYSDNKNTDDSTKTADTLLPTKYSFSNNYPNPFNPTTTFKYALKDEGKVSIRIYNILGKEVITLVNENQPAGYQSVIWNGTDHSGNPVSSGLYFCRITAGHFTKSQKMVLMK